MTIALAALLFACERGPQTHHPETTLAENKMPPATTTTKTRPMRPPIDLMVVPDLQTATFALG